ncbi:MAG: hypothetical protein K2N38_06605 [Oscillospiraceae bacterium]|nr:hypothetical protein [Oscillospiraceae bacterium]
MTRFENKICPVCKAPFNRDAEIVVCPVCGTPHHRVCYAVKNKCALEDLHEKGFVWKGRLPDEPEPQQEAQPATADPHHATYPSETPRITEEELLDRLDPNNPFNEFLSGIADKTVSVDGVSMHELSAYSATSIYHYGRAFRSFRGMNDGKKHKVFFNMCSGLFAPAFQFYRKMDLFGVLVLAVMTLPLLMIVLASMGNESGNVGDGATIVFNILNTAIMVVLCIFGDYIYYRHAVKQIHKIRENFKDRATSDEYYMALYEHGKPSFARAILGWLAMAFMEALVLALPNLLGSGV